MNQNAALLRALKGPPVSIVLALLLYPDRSLGPAKIAQLTGYSDKSVTKGLNTLTELGLAHRHSRYQGWTLTQHCRQLLLPAANPDPTPGETENLRLEPENLRLPAVGSSRILTEPDPDPAPTTDYSQPETETFRLDLFDALRAAGIYHDLAHNLAADPWVTHTRLDAWQADIDRQRRKNPKSIRSPAGLLARNLQHHREPPQQRPAWAKYEREAW